MSRYVRGDSAAFSVLYERTATALLSYLARMTGARDVAEDLLQETFIKVHRARDRYVEGAAPMPWLYAIAHRTFLDHHRKQKRSKVRAREPEKLPEEKAHLTGKREDQVVEQDAEAIERLHRALGTLPPKQRQAVVLTKLEGKSLAEAAEIAGTTVGALKVRVHRGTKGLRDCLGREGADENVG